MTGRNHDTQDNIEIWNHGTSYLLSNMTGRKRNYSDNIGNIVSPSL